MPKIRLCFFPNSGNFAMKISYWLKVIIWLLCFFYLETINMEQMHTVVAQRVKAKFWAMVPGCCNLQDIVMWMKIILNDLSMKYDIPMKLFLDNKSAITISQNIVLLQNKTHWDRLELNHGEICRRLVTGIYFPLRLFGNVPRDYLQGAIRILLARWEWVISQGGIL